MFLNSNIIWMFGELPNMIFISVTEDGGTNSELQYTPTEKAMAVLIKGGAVEDRANSEPLLTVAEESVAALIENVAFAEIPGILETQESAAEGEGTCTILFIYLFF